MNEFNFINVVKYIILGLIQGICEILPVSSSGHLIIVSELLNINDESISFELFLHLASLIAIIIYTRKDIIKLTTNTFKYIKTRDIKYKEDFRYIMYLIISCIPICIVTLLFEDIIEYVNKTIWLIGIFLMINGLVLHLVSRKENSRKEILFKDAIIIGLFQSVAVVPGLSRSGMCISGGITSGLDKKKTIDYSFILFIPIIIIAILKEILFGFKFSNFNVGLYLISFIISFIFTYLSLKILKKVINSNKFKWFGYYTFVIGMIVCVYFLGK